MRILSLSPEFDGKRPVEALVRQKAGEYYTKARWYAAIYYITRVTVALSAATLPFIIPAFPRTATGISIVIALFTAIDIVLKPKELWALYSRASDLVTVALLKQSEGYEESRDAIEILLATEDARMKQVVDIDEITRVLRREKSDRPSDP